MTEELKAKAKQYFEAYPKEEVIHFTTDGQAFLNKNLNDAVNHQRQFTEKKASDKLVSVYKKSLDEKPAAAAHEETPDGSWTKEEIIIWIEEKDDDIKITGKEKKEDLLAIVKLLSNPLSEVDSPAENWDAEDISLTGF